MFNGIAPEVDMALLLAWEEAQRWMLAGARGLSGLITLGLPN